jgi:hypothetical protein
VHDLAPALLLPLLALPISAADREASRDGAAGSSRMGRTPAMVSTASLCAVALAGTVASGRSRRGPGTPTTGRGRRVPEAAPLGRRRRGPGTMTLGRRQRPWVLGAEHTRAGGGHVGAKQAGAGGVHVGAEQAGHGGGPFGVEQASTQTPNTDCGSRPWSSPLMCCWLPLHAMEVATSVDCRRGGALYMLGVSCLFISSPMGDISFI